MDSQSSQGTNRTDDYFTASQDFSFLEFPNTQEDDPYLSGFTGATQAATQTHTHQFDESSEHSQNTSVTDLASQVDGLMNFDETFDEDRSGKDLPEHACVYVELSILCHLTILGIVVFTTPLVLSVVIFHIAKNGSATAVGTPQGPILSTI